MIQWLLLHISVYSNNLSHNTESPQPENAWTTFLPAACGTSFPLGQTTLLCRHHNNYHFSDGTVPGLASILVWALISIPCHDLL